MRDDKGVVINMVREKYGQTAARVAHGAKSLLISNITGLEILMPPL